MKNIENEMPDITKLATNAAPNAKINRLKMKYLVLLSQLLLLLLMLK